jgi:hypothetical protein
MKPAILMAAMAVAMLVAGLPGVAAAQDAPRGEEISIDRMIGTWDCRMGRHECKAIGDVAYYCHSTLSEGEVLWVTWRDAEDDLFRSYRMTSDGYSDSGVTWVDGSTWTTVYEGRTGERAKLVEAWADNDTMNYTWYRSLHGGAWEQGGGGAMTRVQGEVAMAAAQEVPPGADGPFDFLSGSWEFVGLEGGGECRLIGSAGFHCFTKSNDDEALWVAWWDDGDEVYRTYRLYNSGYSDSGVKWMDGDTWTFVYEGRTGGRSKLVTVRTDDDTFEYTWYRSLRGGPWVESSAYAMKKVR